MTIDDNKTYGLKGSEVKDLAVQVKKRAASVNNDGASHVEYANEIYTETLQIDKDSFIFRTTAGTTSISNGDAILMRIKGKTVTEVVSEEPRVIILHNATPTTLVSTGYNQYNATAGYAHVVGNAEYRIDGTYTDLGFTTEVGGATTPVTVVNNRFTPTEDGYIYVTGGVGDILIALVWSGTRDSDPYEAFESTTVTIPTVDASNNPLPTATYGMPSIGNVADEMNLVEKTYIQRIGQYPYTAENLATVQASGASYIYDATNIFYVLDTPITFTLANSVSGDYEANDFGTEWFTGTDVPVSAEISYGQNLVDKLRNLLSIQGVDISLQVVNGILGTAPIVLTDADYNWNYQNHNTTNPNCVALWLLEPGRIYLWGLTSTSTSDDNGVRVLPAYTNISASSDLHLGRMFGGCIVAPNYMGEEHKPCLFMLGRNRGMNSVGNSGAVIEISGVNGTAGSPNYLLDKLSLATAWSQANNERPLAGSLGTELSERIMAYATTSPDSSTYGRKGGLLPVIDTVNNVTELWLCTSHSNNNYVWVKLF